MKTRSENLYEQWGLWTEERLGWMAINAAGRWPEREAFLLEGKRYTYADIARLVTYTSQFLVDQGVGPNSRVLMQMPNCIELVVAQLACWRIGAICVPVISIYRAYEVDYILKDANPTLVIAAKVTGNREPYKEIEDLLIAHGSNVKRVVVGGEPELSSWKQLILPVENTGDIDDPNLPNPAPPDACVLYLYTSGTTSSPKGAMLTGRGILSSLENWWRAIGLSYQDVFMGGSPLAHIAALSAAVLLPMRMGARSVLMTAWNPDLAVQLIEDEKVTYMNGASVFISDLVQRYAKGASKSHRLQTYVSGGSPTSPELVKEADALGVKVVRMYGMTETAGITTTAWRDAPVDRRAYYDGKVDFGTEIQAVDVDKKPLPPGEIGEIRIKSPKLMIGYTNKEVTATQFDADGWFYPGDLGLIEKDGWFRMTGRTKDIINRGGEKFSAADIELALLSFRGILEAAVIPAPDERFGEIVAAYLVLRDGYKWSGPEPILAHLEQIKLAKAKMPVKWSVVESLPKSSTGKLQKHRLTQIS